MISRKPFDETCSGPVDQDNGKCAWCKHEHQGLVHVDGSGVASAKYPARCDQSWPDRPRKSAHPLFRDIKEMLVECWQCHAPSHFNSVDHPEVIKIMLASPDNVLHARCNTCGAGIDIMHAKIMRARAPLMPGGPIIRSGR